MKKNISCILAVGLMLSCCACGGNSTTSATSAEKTSSSAAVVRTEETDNNEIDRSNFKIRVFDTSPTIEEALLIDESGVKISATSLEYTDYNAILNLTIENNNETEINVYSNSGESINNFMTYSYLNCDVPANSSAEDSMEFSFDELEMHGIYEIAEIGIRFKIEDNDYNELLKSTVTLPTSISANYTNDDTSYQTAIIDPQNIDAYKYEVLSWATDSVFNQFGIEIVSELLMKNADGKRMLMLEITNSNDTTVTVQSRNISVNDSNGTDTFCDEECVDPGKRAIMSVNVDEQIENLSDDSDFTDISKVSFDICIYSEQSAVLENEPLEITFS